MTKSQSIGLRIPVPVPILSIYYRSPCWSLQRNTSSVTTDFSTALSTPMTSPSSAPTMTAARPPPIYLTLSGRYRGCFPQVSPISADRRVKYGCTASNKKSQMERVTTGFVNKSVSRCMGTRLHPLIDHVTTPSQTNSELPTP
jgi:hypothetical protein